MPRSKLFAVFGALSFLGGCASNEIRSYFPPVGSEVMVQEELGRDAVVVTVFPDDNKKYLSTDLLREEPVKPGYLAPHIQLLGVRAFKRVCYTCCDPRECVEAAALDMIREEGPPLPHCPRRACTGP